MYLRSFEAAAFLEIFNDKVFNKIAALNGYLVGKKFVHIQNPFLRSGAQLFEAEL